MDSAALADRIDAVLPQTQCTKCGYTGCRPYAEALARGEAPLNQCPPGGSAGIARLAALLGRPALPLNPVHGAEGPLRVAVIDEARCIGCTLCIQVCPVDAIVGAPRRMHTVMAAHCTGCDLCLPACPVDCIAMVEVAPARAWTDRDAQRARARHLARARRLQRDRRDDERAAADGARFAAPPASAEAKQAAVAAALARARQRRAGARPDAGA
jgi:electron transport complex protein RnfB